MEKNKKKNRENPNLFLTSATKIWPLKVTLNYTTGNGLVSSVQMGDDLPGTLFVTSSPNLDALGRIIHSPIKI